MSDRRAAPRLVPPAVAAGSIGATAQPVIESTNGHVLRPLVDADAPRVIEAFRDPDIQYYFSASPDRAFAEAWIAERRAAWVAETNATWAISDGIDGPLLGRVSLDLDLAGGAGAVAYWIVPDSSGRGLAAAATRSVVQWAHETGLHRVALGHKRTNTRSRLVAERCGFTLEGTRRGAARLIDGRHDALLWSHLDGEPDRISVGAGEFDSPRRTALVSGRPRSISPDGRLGNGHLRACPPAIARGTISSGAQPDLAPGRGLRARPFVADDAARVVEAFADPDIRYFHGRDLDLEGARRWIDDAHHGWQAERVANWAVVDADRPDRLLGRVSMSLALAEGHGEVGYWVLPDARGRGIATAACRAATAWAHTLGLYRVELEHHPSNERSRRVAERCGFTFEFVKRSHHRMVDGTSDAWLWSHLVGEADRPPT